LVWFGEIEEKNLPNYQRLPLLTVLPLNYFMEAAKLRWAWGAHRQVLRVNEPKTTGARSTRAVSAAKTHYSTQVLSIDKI
jgi:hypothetical protein